MNLPQQLAETKDTAIDKFYFAKAKMILHGSQEKERERERESTMKSGNEIRQ